MSSVLAGVRGDESDPVVLHAAARLARRVGLPLVVGHVVAVPANLPAGSEIVSQLAADIELDLVVRTSALLDPCGVPWSLAVVPGDAYAGLRALAERHDAAVIVVGTQGGGPRCALRRLIHGSVSSRLIHQQTRPVLVVPPSSSRRPGARGPAVGPFDAASG